MLARLGAKGTYEPSVAATDAASTLSVSPSVVNAPGASLWILQRHARSRAAAMASGTIRAGSVGWCSRALEVLVCAHANARVRQLAEHARRQTVHETHDALVARHLQSHRPERVGLCAGSCEHRSPPLSS